MSKTIEYLCHHTEDTRLAECSEDVCVPLTHERRPWDHCDHGVHHRKDLMTMNTMKSKRTSLDLPVEFPCEARVGRLWYPAYPQEMDCLTCLLAFDFSLRFPEAWSQSCASKDHCLAHRTLVVYESDLQICFPT